MNNVTDLVFDGNSAATLLRRLFVPDITLARIRCEACDCLSSVGSLALYAAPMGAVLKCASCENVLIRAVDTPHGLWLEMTGARTLRFVTSTEQSFARQSTEAPRAPGI
jgi:hypothetical protein